MTINTKLHLTDKLQLTCSRSGTCCHGKMVRLNPFELACLSKSKKMSTRNFRDQYCEFGGIRLRFNGASSWKNLAACSQYIPNYGCSVHPSRPLVCRLYPLGREKKGDEIYYMYQGAEFPCFEGCPEVKDLPQLSVAEYITGQETKNFETAQDEYLEIMQSLADVAFSLLLESGLAESGDRQTLRLWRELGRKEPQLLIEKLGSEWIDLLLIPEVTEDLCNPVAFCKQHQALLETKAQESFGALDKATDICEASGIMMGLALHLARGLGAEPAQLAEHWIKTAKKHGAKD